MLGLGLFDTLALAVVLCGVIYAVWTQRAKIIEKLTNVTGKATTAVTQLTAPEATSIAGFVGQVVADADKVTHYAAWRVLYNECSACPIAQKALVEVVLPALSTGADLVVPVTVSIPTTPVVQ